MAGSNSSYSIVLNAPTPLQPKDVDIVAGPAFNRTPLPAADHHIDEEWASRLKKIEESMKKLSLFNKTKFRLHEASMVEGTGRCAIKLGITDYQSCIGTNNKLDIYRAAVPEADRTDAAVDATLSQALGVEALVVTRDDHVVLFKRSMHVAELPGWYCLPGGHAEPSNVLKDREHMLGGTAKENAAVHDEMAAALAAAGSDAIAHELFGSIAEEVVAECGVAAGDVQNLGLKAIILSSITRKPDAIFVVQVDRTAAEVDAAFRSSKATEDYEVDGPLIFLPVAEVKAALAQAQKDGAAAPGGVLATYKITPPSLACLELCL